MAREPRKLPLYCDTLPKVDAMSNVEPAIEQEALEEARQNAAENPISREDTIRIAKESKRGKKQKSGKSEETSKADDFATSENVSKSVKLYRHSFLSAYKHLLTLGIKESVIARIFGMRDNAFANIKQNGDKGIKKAYKEAMKELEVALTANMLKQAIGYDYVEVETTYEPKMIDDGVSLKKNFKPTKRLLVTKVRKTQKHYPGRPQLFLAYMATHFPEKWKIKGADGAGGVHFHITGEVVSDQLDKLAGKYLTRPVESNVIENEADQNNDG